MKVSLGEEIRVQQHAANQRDGNNNDHRNRENKQTAGLMVGTTH